MGLPSTRTFDPQSNHKSVVNVASRPRSWFVGIFWWPHLARMKRQNNINGLVSTLTHPRPTVRWAATRILGELWEVPLLVDLGHHDHNRRTQATKSLKGNKDTRITLPLIAALWDPYDFYDYDSGWYFYPVRTGAIETLASIGIPEAIEPILGAVRNGSCNPHSLPLGLCLAQMGEPILKPLIALLDDKDSYMRQVAVDALGELGNPQAIQPLNEFLQREKHSYLQHNTRVALSQIKNEQTVSILAEVSEGNAIQLIEAGNLPAGRAMLEQLLEQDEVNEQAWLWLSKAVDDTDTYIVCLENVLAINPDNAEAYNRLKELDALPEQKELKIPPTQDISEPAVASEREMKE